MRGRTVGYRAVVWLLVASLGVGGCGWFSRSKARRAGASEAVRATPPPEAGRSLLAVERPPLPNDAAVVDRVIAVVNEDAITLSQLQSATMFYLYESKAKVQREEERALRERLLNRLIDTRLQLQEAARERITVEDAEVEEQLAEVMKRSGVKTEEELAKAVRAEGLSVEEFRKRVREQLMIQKVVRRKVQLRVSVTEQEIERYFQENREKLETGLTYRARHIMLKPARPEDEAAWEAARARAEEVWAALQAGEEFEALARRYSDDPTAKEGGDLGVLKQGELVDELERQILRLSPGEVSPPYRSKLGVHIFKLESKETLSGDTLRQAKQQIRDILFREKYRARLEAWLAEIKKRAVIDVRL